MNRACSKCSPLFFCSVLMAVSFGAASQTVQYSSGHVNQQHALPQSLSSRGTATLKAKLAGNRTGISLAVADFDTDGTQDLLTGYATASGGVLLLQRGSPVAFSPTPNEWAMTQRGELVAPFVATSEPVDLPVRPDLIKAADFSGHGHVDVIVAQKGDASVYLLLGDGKGGFSAPQALAAGGRIASLETWRGPNGENLIVAGVCVVSGCGLRLLDQTGSTIAFVPTPASPDVMEIARFNRGIFSDFAIIAGGNVLLVDGDSALTGAPRTETLPVSHAAALASGYFLYDRRGVLQLAILDASATLHILTRAGLDTRVPSRKEAIALRTAAKTQPRHAPAKLTDQPWAEAETLHNIGPGDGSTPLMLHGHVTASGRDDIAVLAGSQYVLVSHPTQYAEGAAHTTTKVATDSFSEPVVAAVATRVAADARLGIVTLGSRPQPAISKLPAYRTMTVNSTTDAAPTTASMNLCINGSAGCELRSAIAVANADYASTTETKADTINVNAGTYTISVTNNGSTYDAQGNYNYHYDVDSSINLVGAGASTTTINANNLDQSFEFNAGIVRGTASNEYYAPAVLDDYLSGLTLENGYNKNNPSSTECMMGSTNPAIVCLNRGGAFLFDTYGSGALTLVNVTMTANTTIYGDGGGFAMYNSTCDGFEYAGTGSLEIDTSSFTNNTTAGYGGAIRGGSGGCINSLLNTVTLSGNSANASLNNSVVGYDSAGGGIYIDGLAYEPGGSTVTMTSVTATGNSATDQGGGIWLSGRAIMTGLTVTNNTGGSFGGGLFNDSYMYPNSITASTFTGNNLIGNSNETYGGGGGNANGGGICTDADGAGETASSQYGNLAIHYSRFHGNTITSSKAGLKATGLGVSCVEASNGYAVVNATDNWWGCNGAATGTGCDTALDSSSATQTLTLTPYTTLTLAATGGTSVSATGSLGQDSAGTNFSAANDAPYLLTPWTTFTLTDVASTATNSTLLNQTSGSSYATVTATGTANATGTGTATLTVDGQTVTRTYSATQPADMTVSSAHSGNFKAGDTADTYTLTAYNIGSEPTTAAVTVVDTLPTGFTATALSGVGWTCTLSSLSCSRSDQLAASVSYPAITLTVSIAGSDAGTYGNSVTVSGGGETNVNNDTYSDSTNVIGTPTMSEAFNPTSVVPNTNSTVTFTLGNPPANTISLTGVAFSDTLPTGLKVSTPSNASTTCNSSTVTATAGSGSIVLSGTNIAAGATCTVSVAVNSASSGSYTNTTGNVSATNSNAGGTASATLTVTLAAPAVSASFSPATVVSGGTNASTSTLTIVLTNNNSVAITGVAFTDMFPNQIQAFSPPATSCGGIINSNGNTVVFSGGSLPANSSCSVTISVIAAVTTGTTGTYTDSTGTVTSSNAPTGTAATAALTVAANPTKLVYTSSPATPIIAGGNSGTFTVALEDANGNVTTYYAASGSVTVTVTAGGYLQTYSGPVSNGVATFNLSSIPLTSAQTYTYTATYSGLTSATATEVVNPGAAASLSVIGLSTFIAPQMSGTATVRALDAYGNVATGFTGMVTLTSTDALAAFSPTSYTYTTADAGTHNFTVTLNTAGTQTVTANSGALNGSETGILVEDSIIVLNSNSTLVRMTDAGVQTTAFGSANSTTATYGAVAFDNAGDIWAVNNATSAVQEYTRSGATVTVSGSSSAGVTTPVSLFIDGIGQVWVANGNNSVSVLSTAGTAVSPSTGYQGGNMNTPSGIIVDNAGSVWLSNRGNNSVTKIFGAAAPVVTPTVTGTANNTLGTRP
jgi:hypothetical protein